MSSRNSFPPAGKEQERHFCHRTVHRFAQSLKGIYIPLKSTRQNSSAVQHWELSPVPVSRSLDACCKAYTTGSYVHSPAAGNSWDAVQLCARRFADIYRASHGERGCGSMGDVGSCFCFLPSALLHITNTCLAMVTDNHRYTQMVELPLNTHLVYQQGRSQA